ncbi:MAG: carboxypeptidase regulatory-like domain-containing protein [Acidobacteria bacterium]|nr:carboxypeptidase regulatory-like domain-containing protein [Acidobacteriota bacterium]
MKRLISHSVLVMSLAFVFALPFYGQKPKPVMIQGTLIKSDGKPLAYTEIELVPVGSGVVINDTRLFGITDQRGRFNFVDVPDGNYTLSINFGDKPTLLSPYPTYFLPGTAKRSEAQVLEVNSSTKIAGLIFRLLPPLVRKTITGKVTWPDGSPVRGAWIGVVDIEFDLGKSFGNARSDINGIFKVDGFVGQRYQFGAIIFEKLVLQPFEDPGEVIGFGETEIIKFDGTNTTIGIKVRRSKRNQQIMDKYLG